MQKSVKNSLIKLLLEAIGKSGNITNIPCIQKPVNFEIS
jgi:hypothetical protein